MPILSAVVFHFCLQVDNIIIMINHALSNQIDWKELALIVEDAKQRDDPLACHIVELKLQTSQAVIRLK